MTGAERTAGDSTERFVAFAASRDPQLRAELIEEHLWIARYLAGRYSHRGEPYDDLMQVASVALIGAVDRFDPARGVRFSTFATKSILGELKRHFRDRGWTVRAPRRVQELYLEVNTTAAELAQRHGRAATVPELATALDTSVEAVLEALEAGHGYRSESIDAPSGAAGDQALGARLGGDDPGFTSVEDGLTVETLLSSLPDRLRGVVELRYYEGLSQAEIAARTGVSQMQISRLLARALTELRRGLVEEPEQASHDRARDRREPGAALA
jgi:RNA polymerase sigma-B factor